MRMTIGMSCALILGALSLATGTGLMGVSVSGSEGGGDAHRDRVHDAGALDESEWKEFVELVCLDCHQGPNSKGGLDLGAALLDPTAHGGDWERAYIAVQGRFMPPATGTLGAGLDEDERREWTEGLIDFLGADGQDPGAPTIRRLTRSQLKGVLLDLLGLQVDVDRFLPRDASGYGFDTTGDTLFVSPYYFEVWFELVEAVLEGVRSDRRAAARVFDPSRSTREQLVGLVGRAFRRPATEEEMAARLAIIEGETELGRDAESAFLEAVRATLLSPSFFFRTESGTDETQKHSPVDGHTLASRLSFFLWGTLPDEELRAHAAVGDIHDAGVLESEVLRMLADPRAAWLARDFAMQWLGASELVDVTPDVRRFRAFNEGLRRAMEAEVLAFFGDLVRHDRSLLECLDSDHAFLNGRLAKHYGIAGVEGHKVRRVPVGDRRRGGVLGMGAVLTVTSEPLRTSPVKRGQWVLDRLLRSPSPPPPPGAGVLPEDDQQEDGLSLRERLIQHRADPTCASCHARMDPLGFALEGLDGIGRIREVAEGAEPVDDHAVLEDGRGLEGVVGLKGALLAEPERFVRAFAEHLFVYAIGRPPGLSDHRVLDGIVRNAAENGYRLSSVVLGIVRTPAFQRRRAPQAPGTLGTSQAPEPR